MENNQNNQSNQKKTLILSIIGILVLVIAVVGVSFAMFTFSGTGVKENILRTGTISVDFDTATKQNKIEITNQYPESDATGANPTDTSNETTFTVEGSWGSSPMTVNYEVGLSDISAGSTLTAQYVKFNFQKNGSYVKGSATTGVTVASIASTAGPKPLISSYYITNGTLTNGDLTDTFKVKAWVSDAYDLPVDAANSDTENGGSKVITQQDGSAKHIKTSKSETFSFKVKVVAEQA